MLENKDEYGQLLLINKKSEGLDLDNVLMSVSRQNNIVETVVIGHEGTVKEFVTAQDWAVDLRILVRSPEAQQNGQDNSEYPYKAVKEAIAFLKKGESYEVSNDVLRIFEITNVVIKSISIAATPHTNTQEIHVSAVSDETFELTVKD